MGCGATAGLRQAHGIARQGQAGHGERSGPEADAPLNLQEVPDVVGRLVTTFLADVPSPRHRLALELSAHARFTRRRWLPRS